MDMKNNFLEKKWELKCHNEFGIYKIFLNDWRNTYQLLVDTDMFNLNDEFVDGYTYRMIYLQLRSEKKTHRYEDEFISSVNVNKSEKLTCPTKFRYLNH